MPRCAGAPVADAVIDDLDAAHQAARRARAHARARHDPRRRRRASARYIGMKQEQGRGGRLDVAARPPARRRDAGRRARRRSTASTPTPRSTRILVQHPPPPQLDYEAALLAIDPDKDADGLHPVNLGRLVLGVPGPVPCTPAGHPGAARALRGPDRRAHVVHPRARHHDRPAARDAALAEAADRERGGHRRAHRRARLAALHAARPTSWSPRRACPGSSSPSTSRPGAVVVGGGVRYEGRKLLPDVDERARRSRAGSRPASAGSGPTTIAMLFRNAVEAAERNAA